MLSRLLAVLLAEAPDQFLEDGPHAVVVEAGVPDRAVGVHHRIGTQVDVRLGQLLDKRTQGDVGPVGRDSDPNGIQRCLHVEYGPLGGLQHGAQPPEHCHRQDHVSVRATHVDYRGAYRPRCARCSRRSSSGCARACRGVVVV